MTLSLLVKSIDSKRSGDGNVYTMSLWDSPTTPKVFVQINSTVSTAFDDYTPSQTVAVTVADSSS